MADTAPLRPIIGYRPKGQAAERWLSLWAWGYETSNAHTTVHVTPSMFTRDPDDRLVLKMQLFSGRLAPLAVYESAPQALGEHLHVTLREVLDADGIEDFDGPLQIQAALTRDPKPGESRVIETWATTYTDDGLMGVSYPSIGLAGLPSRSTAGGGIQCLPGVMVNGDYDSQLVVLNPYPRDFTVAIRLYRPSGEYVRSVEHPIRKLTVLRESLEALLPEAREWLAASGGIGTLMTETTYKMVQYLLIRARATGQCSGMDHLLPIYP